MKSHEAMDRCIGRNRVAVAKALGRSSTLISKWQEPTGDYTDSGSRNPIDWLELTMSTAIHEGQPKDLAVAPIEYLAHKFGLTVIPLPEATPSMKDVVRQSHRSIKEFGDYITAFSESIEDDRISPLERKRIEVEGMQAIQQIMAVLKMIEEH